MEQSPSVLIMDFELFILFIIIKDVKIQDDKDPGRRSIRHSIQGPEHKNRRNSGNKKDEAKICKLERMHLTAIDKIFKEIKPFQHN